jgi:hypothetical protein
MNTSMRIGSGSTPAGSTAWKPYDPNSPIPGRGIYVDVDTTAAGFKNTPNYVASLCGKGNHWEVCGSNAIYNPTNVGFRIYLRYSWNAPGHEQPPLTPAFANAAGHQWYVSWIGVEA